MPRSISGQDAATRLQTIVQSANDHGKGTLYVGREEVAHRTTLGRLFKRNPTQNRDSIQKFKEILKANYGEHSDKIDSLLQGATTKGRLTAGTVKRVTEQLKEHVALGQYKYVFQYPPKAKSIDQKLRHEDEHALQVLSDSATRDTVCAYALKLADRIEQVPNFEDLHAEMFLEEHLSGHAEYPVAFTDEQIPKTKAGLLAHLRDTAASQDPERHVLLLSMMWRLANFVAAQAKLDQAYLINDIYADKVKAGKHHVKTGAEDAVTQPGTFGNTEIPSTLMDRFRPHQKEREAVHVVKRPNDRVAKFLKAGNPYISGASGMANAGSSIFPLLNIDMRSSEAKRYGEALSAFIVGAGEHSYPEVYKSLNLSLKYVQLARPLIKH